MSTSRVYLLDNPSDLVKFRGVTGLYSFWDCGLCVYVGKADCLMSRVSKQMKRFIFADEIKLEPLDIDGLSYIEVKQYLRLREAMLIDL